MKTRHLLADFSHVYQDGGFADALLRKGVPFSAADLSGIEGTACYCDAGAGEEILRMLPAELPRVRWIDSGDYHYMSFLLSLRETRPFHLVLMDNHPDNQAPAFGGILSCGSWVKALEEENPMLRDILAIGPEEGVQALDDSWIEQRRGERVYISLDKDVMGRPWARTDWSQGTHTLEEVKGWLGRLLDGRMDVAAVDICGELSAGKGATPEDYRINLETNIELQLFIDNYLN